MVTVTLTGACAVEASVEGGCWVNVSEGGSLTIVVIAMPELAGVDAEEVAVMVTTPPVGTVAGAV